MLTPLLLLWPISLVLTWLVAEGRESGTVGIYSHDGHVRDERPLVGGGRAADRGNRNRTDGVQPTAFR